MNEHRILYDLLRKLGLTPVQAGTGEFLFGHPLKIALLLVAGVLCSRVGAQAARRSLATLQARSPLRRGSPRAAQRLATVGDVLAALIKVVVWSIVALLVLGQVGLDLAPLVAGAGIGGIAVGFGAQSLVRDFLAGLFILMEDQYGVGDVVNLGEANGTVEEMGLRVTRLRATDGTVWFVNNGEITRVGNSSMEWSRALVDVPVAYGADVGTVIGYLREVAAGLAADPEWADQVLEAPEVWGVQDIGADALTIRLAVKTPPRRHFPVARELRCRISDRLRREGVEGPGQTMVLTTSAADRGGPPPPPVPETA